MHWVPAFNFNDMIPVEAGERLREFLIVKQDDGLTDPNFPMTVQNFLNRDNALRRKPLHQRWSMFFKMSKIVPLQSPTVNMATLRGAYISTTSPADTQFIKWMVDFPPITVGTLALGTMYVTYYLGAKYRR